MLFYKITYLIKYLKIVTLKIIPFYDEERLIKNKMLF
jgi:hypothetical protein